jgi:GNAT superfamily N-acetyltransferase
VGKQARTLHAVDGREFRKWLGSVLSVYAAAMDPPRDQINGRRPIIERHLTYPGFASFFAFEHGRLVGFCYGFHGEPGQWWHDAVYRGLWEAHGRDAAYSWLRDSFEVAELQVLPSHQKQGIGRRLITTICEDRRECTTILSTFDVNSPAHHLYRSLGYKDLLTAFRFPGGSEIFAIMGAPLPLPGADPARAVDRSPGSRWIG